MKPLFKRPLLLIIGLLNSFILLSQDFSNLDFMVLELKSVSCYEGDECRFIFTNYNNDKLEFDWFLPFNAKEGSPEKEFIDKYGGVYSKAFGSTFQVYYDKNEKNPGTCDLVNGEGYFCTPIKQIKDVPHTYRNKNIKGTPQKYFNMTFYTQSPSGFYKIRMGYNNGEAVIIDAREAYTDYNIEKGNYKIEYEYYSDGGLDHSKSGYLMIEKNKTIDLDNVAQYITENEKLLKSSDNSPHEMGVIYGEFSTEKALKQIYGSYSKDGDYFKWDKSIVYKPSEYQLYKQNLGGYKSKVNDVLNVNERVKILIIETEPEDQLTTKLNGNLFTMYLFKRLNNNWALTNSICKQAYNGNFEYINLGNEVGVTIKNYESRMGYYTEWVEFYLPENETFKMVLKVTTSNDNSGAVSSASERYGYKSEISSLSSGNEFYDIHIHKKGKEKVSGSIIELDETQIYKYNGEKYVLH